MSYQYAKVLKVSGQVSIGSDQATSTSPVPRIQLAGGTALATVSSAELAAQGVIALREVATNSRLTSTTDFSSINTSNILSSRVWNPSTPIPTTLVLTSVDNASGGNSVYHGTITSGASNAYAGAVVIIFGFTNSANNGIFTCTASTATTVTLNNASGAAETHAASCLFPGQGFGGIENHVIIDPSSTQLMSGAQLFASENQLALNGKTTGGVAHCIDATIYGSPGAVGTSSWDELKCLYSEILFGDSVHASVHNVTLTVGLNAGTHGWLTPAVGTITTSWAINIEGPRIPTGATVSTRRGIRMASQYQTAGGTNTDPWGIYEEGAAERNSLGKIYLGGGNAPLTAPLLSSGTGSPEGVVTGVPGSVFYRTDGGQSSSLYVKSSGSGNTGWVAGMVGSTDPASSLSAYLQNDAGIAASLNQIVVIDRSVSGVNTKRKGFNVYLETNTAQAGNPNYDGLQVNVGVTVDANTLPATHVDGIESIVSVSGSAFTVPQINAYKSRVSVTGNAHVGGAVGLLIYLPQVIAGSTLDIFNGINIDTPAGGGTLTSWFGAHLGVGLNAMIGMTKACAVSAVTSGDALVTTSYGVVTQAKNGGLVVDDTNALCSFLGHGSIAGNDFPLALHDGWYSGNGSPETVVSAAVGSFFSRRNGGVGSAYYLKELGSGNTGWSKVGSQAVVSKVAGYTATIDDDVILCNGTFTITLPSNFVLTKKLTIKNTGVGTITVSSGVNIDGATSFTITGQYASADVAWDLTQWWIV